MLFSCFSLFFIPQIWASTDELVLTVNSQSEYKVGQFPSISGLVTDSDGNPINDVEIQASFPSRTILSSTNTSGEFSITSPIPAELGEYTIITSATKNKLFVDAKITYDVKENKSKTPLRILPQGIEIGESNQIAKGNITQTTSEGKSNLIPNEIIQHPFANTIPPQIELQNNNELKQTIVVDKSQNINEQKQKIAENESNDIKLLEKENESKTPRNAFLQFLDDIDSAVKNIFWGQFLLTEKKSDQGHDAKEKALDEGKSPKEAMESFHKAAAVTRNEIIEHNNKLNVEFGNATSSVQEQFDEQGKLRTGK
jgi:hypothetical protein